MKEIDISLGMWCGAISACELSTPYETLSSVFLFPKKFLARIPAVLFHCVVLSLCLNRSSSFFNNVFIVFYIIN